MCLMRMKKPSLQPHSFRRLPPSERASQNSPLERVLGKTLDVTLQRHPGTGEFFPARSNKRSTFNDQRFIFPTINVLCSTELNGSRPIAFAAQRALRLSDPVSLPG